MQATLGSLLTFTSLASVIVAIGLDPLNNFCRRWYHQSQVKNGMLFIQGGIESFSDRSVVQYGNQPNWTGPITTGPNNYVIAINMSTSWDWKSNISEIAINLTTPLQTGNPVPRVQSAVLFQGAPDDPQIYLYGGVTPSINKSFPYWQWPTTNQYTLWGFNTQAYNWIQYDIFSSVPERPSWGASAEASERGLAFYLNGLISNESSVSTENLGSTTISLEGMVVLDLNNQTATNRSTATMTDGNPRVRGGLVYISGLASKGVLVTVGGATGSSLNLNLVSMNQVNIFDIASLASPDSSTSSNGWYTQTIAGTAPDPRIDFCLVLASAPDNSSFNIYMYGGWDPTQTNKYFDEIWVLSLPSFSWIKIYSGTAPRFGHTCHAVGNRQMITVGGLDNINATDYCDWEYKSVAIYDLTEGESVGWGSVFSAGKAPYQVNAQISAVIGGGPNGNATKLLPYGGWSNTLVASLFTGTTNQTAPVPISGSTTTPALSAPSSTKSTRKGAIAGGVAGGIGVIAIICALILLTRRYLKMPRKVHAEVQQQYLKSEMDGKGTVICQSSSKDEEISPMEMPPSVYQTHSEISGNQRSEVCGGQIPAEVAGCDVAEMD